MDKKKVLMVTGSLRMGGLERVAVDLVKYSNRDEYIFDFLVFNNEGAFRQEIELLGCRIIKISSPKKGYRKFFNELRRVINTNGGYDIVHSHLFFNSGIVLMAAYSCRVPIRIAHSHSIGRKGESLFKRTIYNSLMRILIHKYANKICACSQKAGYYLFGEKWFVEKGIVIPNIVDVRSYLFNTEERKTIRAELSIGADDIVLGMVGRLEKVKNPLFLLRVFEKVYSRGNYWLLIAGDGSLKSKMRNEIKQQKLDNKVLLLGIRKDVNRLLSAMDVLLCTSKNEGLGIVLLEAQANGLPAIAEEHAVVDEIRDLGNCNMVNGFDNIDDWVYAIEKCTGNGRNADGPDKLSESIFTKEALEKRIQVLYSQM